MNESNASLQMFSGENDSTLEEVQVWKQAFSYIASSSIVHVKKLSEAKDILAEFYTKNQRENPANMGLPAANRFIQLLSTVSAFHSNAVGGLEMLTDPEGPYIHLLSLNDKVFELLKAISESYLAEHMKLERTAEEALKYYHRRLLKRAALSKKLSKTLSPEQIEKHRKYCIFTSKVDVARLRYINTYEIEEKERKNLAEKTDEIKRHFVKEEKHRLDVMLDSINNLLTRLEEVVPAKMKLPDDNKCEPEAPDTMKMAKESWQDHLNTYTFPENKAASGEKKNWTAETSVQDEATTGRYFMPKLLPKSQLNKNKMYIQNLDNRGIGLMEDVTVTAIKERRKEKRGEISIRVGMKIKQTNCMNCKGMAYGYKKNRLGWKIFGFYPVDNVVLFEQ